MIIEAITRFAASCTPGSGGIIGIPTWYRYLEGDVDETGRCTVVFSFPDDIGKVLLALVEILLRIGGLVAVAFVVYGGIQFILSQGEPDKARTARRTIVNALVGLIIALLSTFIVTFIGRRLVEGQT